jgi:hypothetical protein
VDSLWREPMPAHQRPTPDTITSAIPGTLS